MVIRRLPGERDVDGKVNSIKARTAGIQTGSDRRTMAFCFLGRADIAYHTGSPARPYTVTVADADLGSGITHPKERLEAIKMLRSPLKRLMKE